MKPKPATPSVSRLGYTFPASRLQRGHSYGNAQIYLTLDRNSDVIHEPNSNRLGLRDARDQEYYLLGWKTELVTSSGQAFAAKETTMRPESQQTTLPIGAQTATKTFIVPYENNHLRSAHVLFTETGRAGSPEPPSAPPTDRGRGRSGGAALPSLRSRIVLPASAGVAEATQHGRRHLVIHYGNDVTGVLWGSGDLRSLASEPAGAGRTAWTAEFAWPANSDECALSFAYAPGSAAPTGAVYENFAADAGSAASHLRRVKVIAEETSRAIARHLDTCRLWTPDAFITDGVQWAKVNQLKDWQDYRAGPGFSNCPPSDVLVGRDTFWFLVSTNYYQPAWSRRLLEFWFRAGQEPTGKFIEYMLASREPVFRDDYGLNVNDNTPLLLISTHDYCALSGDRGFLDSVYTAVLRAANYLLDQRNDAGLIWCRSRDTFVRGLCGWRNCTGNYQLSGAVTEINAECQRAIALTADLAAVVGDRRNAARLKRAAADLFRAIDAHLRADTKANPFYLLMIDPDGQRRADLTGDLLFPALFGMASRPVSRAILAKLFSAPFWREDASGAGGMHTISPEQAGFQPKADPSTYGLQGGVWPNLALWAARAAADAGQPELIVKALRATRRLADRDDFENFNVTPGEFPEYFNGDDLVQRGHPRSTFIHGSYLWAAWEGLLGLTPRASGLAVNPQLPTGWNWVALSRLDYRGAPLTLLALRQGRTLYTTARVKTKWKQVVVSAELQDRYRIESDAPVFWLVTGREVIAASDVAAAARLIERASGRIAAEFRLVAGEVTRRRLPAKRPR